MPVLENIKTPSFVLKIVEIALSAIALGISATLPMSGNIMKLETVHTALIGFMLVNIVIVLTYIVGEIIDFKLIMLLTAVGAIMVLTGGAIILETYSLGTQEVRLLLSGIISIINCCVHAVDVVLTYRYYS